MTKTYELLDERTIMADVDEKHHMATVNVYILDDLVEAVNKTGHWIRWYEQKENERCIEHIPHCKCSECGKEYDSHSSQFIKFCPNCGARMVEQETKINEDISKGFEEFTRMMFKQGQKESMTFSEKNCNTCGQKCAIKYYGCSNWMPTVIEADKVESEDKNGRI